MTASLKNNFFANARSLTFSDANGITWSFNPNTNTLTAAYSGAGSSGASPTAKVGLTAVNGTAATFMRSDAAPPIDLTIAPTWTATHIFSVPPVIGGMAWTAPTLLNSWANFGSGFNPAGYYKDPTGRVFLRGFVRNGATAGSVIFQLPVGFRPATICAFPGLSNNALCSIEVDTSGNVFIAVGGSTTSVSLDSISFATF